MVAENNEFLGVLKSGIYAGALFFKNPALNAVENKLIDGSAFIELQLFSIYPYPDECIKCF